MFLIMYVLYYRDVFKLDANQVADNNQKVTILLIFHFSHLHYIYMDLEFK